MYDSVSACFISSHTPTMEKKGIYYLHILALTMHYAPSMSKAEKKYMITVSHRQEKKYVFSGYKVKAVHLQSVARKKKTTTIETEKEGEIWVCFVGG